MEENTLNLFSRFKKAVGMKTGGHEFKFGLGCKLKDSVTGFNGICTGRHQWLNMCNTYTLRPAFLKDGIPIDSIAFDENQLFLMESEPVHKSHRNTGGPEIKVPEPNQF